MDERPTSSQLVIELDRDSDAVKLVLHGELDLSSAPLLEGELEDVEASGHSRLVIDLSGLEFMDSAGLHMLLKARNRSLANGHDLTLRRGPRAIQRLFELTNTAAAFRFDD